MTRIEAQGKGLYYPSPEPVIRALVPYLGTHTGAGEVRVLDPCVGKGRALALLVQAWREHLREQWSRYSVVLPHITTYGIEPNLVRVKEARGVIDEVLHASYFQTLLSNGDSSDGGFQLALVNPPYDWDKESKRRSGKSERLEITFLERTTQKLSPYGVIIWIVPQAQLLRAARYLSQWYIQITVRRFPDEPFATPEMQQDGQAAVPMWGMFKQIIVIARRRSMPSPHDPREVARLEELGRTENLQLLAPLLLSQADETIPRYTVPVARDSLRYFHASNFDAEESAAMLLAQAPGASASPEEQGRRADVTLARPSMGVWSKADYWAQRWPSALARQLSIGRPLAPLKRGHMSIVAVAGIANRAVLEGRDGRQVIVKGYSRKRSVTRVRDEEDAVVTEKKDRFETALWCIDVQSGQLMCVDTGSAAGTGFDVPFEPVSLPKFLDNFGVALTARIAESNPPLYGGPHQVPWAKAALAQLKRQPLGRQRDFILAMVNALAGSGEGFERLARAGEIAEMATGKTFLSLAILYLADLYLSGLIDAFPRRRQGRAGASRRRGPRPLHFAPVLVMCPEIIAYKWKREAEMTLPQVKAVVVQRIDTREKAAEFRLFDPTWSGTHLSSVGCMERVIGRIRADLERWRAQFQEARRARGPLPPKPCHLVIVPSNVAKLGMEWSPVYRLRPVRSSNEEGKIQLAREEESGRPLIVPCCPTCFAPVKDQARIDKLAKNNQEYGKRLRQLERRRARGGTLPAYEDDLGEEAAAYVAEEELWGSGESRKKRWCASCGEPLWQYLADGQTWSVRSVLRQPLDEVAPLPLPVDLARLPACVKAAYGRRFPVADYVRRYHRGFFKLLIADEVHQGADGTALDFARRSFMVSCESYLGFTGTLCNGYSSSLFPFAYGINPRVRRRFAHNDAGRWVDLYGVRKTTTKEYKDEERGHGAMSKRRTGGKGVESEMAGFAPHGLAEVLPCCAFLELADVAPNLPPYKEEVDIVPMGEQLGQAYRRFESTISRVLGAMLVRGDKRGLAAWFQSLLRYPNLPYLGCTCEIKKTGEVLGTAPALPAECIYPKEQRIIDLVQGELEQNRRVLIYVEDTGEYDIQPRYRALLEEHVRPRNGNALKVSVLRANTVPTMKREEWLRTQVEGGCNVLICNSALVQVGLDLVDFHTIISAVCKSTSQMRQSFRRIHRPGQTKHTKVIIPVYPTMESKLLKLMARKMQTSLMVEGQIPGQGLVTFGAGDDDDSDFVLTLAREVLAGMEQSAAGMVDADPMQEAEALQQMFREVAELERQQNEVIGLAEDPTEAELVAPPQLEPITVEALSTSTEAEPLPPVTVVPVVLTGDPWAVWRAKRDALDTRHKRPAAVLEVTGSLWGGELPQAVVSAGLSAAPERLGAKARAKTGAPGEGEQTTATSNGSNTHRKKRKQANGAVEAASASAT